MTQQIILVVEDDLPTFELIQAMLSLPDVRLFHGMNGTEALEIIEQHRPHLILMDLFLPSATLTGYDVIQKLRADTDLQDIPIIAMTAGDQEKVQLAYRVGCDYCVRKPFVVSELRSVVKKFLSARNNS